MSKRRPVNLKAFLDVEAKVAVDGMVADPVVSIGRGNFTDRGHNLIAKTKMDSVLPQKFCRGSESISVGLATDDVNVDEPRDDFNIIIPRGSDEANAEPVAVDGKLAKEEHYAVVNVVESGHVAA